VTRVTSGRATGRPQRLVGAVAAGPGRIARELGRSAQWFQLGRFLLVGGSGYIVNLAVFALAFAGFGMHHLLSATVAFLAALTNNFFLNRHWTFKGPARRKWFQAPRFLLVSVVAFGLAAGVLALLVDVFAVHPFFGQALAIVVATPFNFVANKLWTFRRPSADRAQRFDVPGAWPPQRNAPASHSRTGIALARR
jgi:putative flippase GtrA